MHVQSEYVLVHRRNLSKNSGGYPSFSILFNVHKEDVMAASILFCSSAFSVLGLMAVCYLHLRSIFFSMCQTLFCHSAQLPASVSDFLVPVSLAAARSGIRSYLLFTTAIDPLPIAKLPTISPFGESHLRIKMEF